MASLDYFEMCMRLKKGAFKIFKIVTEHNFAHKNINGHVAYFIEC